ncbi:MAG: outer membrane protein assembly factor BamE [Neomegalonema sp.]|nr:outer membrane protein assembly factor BamE [Neomegalonema sp.]
MIGRNFKSSRTIACLTAAALLLGAAGCSPIIETHGYTPRADELDSIRKGFDTRGSVQRKLGRPSTLGALEDDVWLYVSQRTETLAFYERQIVDQRVVLIEFDERGIVADVSRYGLEDGRIVDLVTRTTPTGGRKLTILQQAFANLGRFSKKKKSAATGK